MTGIIENTVFRYNTISWFLCFHLLPNSEVKLSKSPNSEDVTPLSISKPELLAGLQILDFKELKLLSMYRIEMKYRIKVFDDPLR